MPNTALPATKPTIGQLIAKVQAIAVALGGTAEVPDHRYRLAMSIYLPNGIPLFFQSDRTGLRLEISISCMVEKKYNPIGWAKIAEFLPAGAWSENIWDSLSIEVCNATTTTAWGTPDGKIVKAIRTKLLTPEVEQLYLSGLNRFIESKQHRIETAAKLKRIWDLCQPSTQVMRLEQYDSQISWSQVRVRDGHGGLTLELDGLSEQNVVEILKLAGRVKGN
jgi:hypothetical protein